MLRPLKGKHILVTAGPTWVAIDRVRVITSVFSGQTGCTIAKCAKKLGANVTLLLGPGRVGISKGFNGIRVIRFHYFQDLFKLCKKEISSKGYDCIIHSAAISDYEPTESNSNKIPSGKSNLVIKFKPTPKIIGFIKKWDSDIILVQFKLEVGKSKEKLLKIAARSMLKNNSDLCVANDLNKLDTLYVIRKGLKPLVISGRKKLSSVLLNLIGKAIN